MPVVALVALPSERPLERRDLECEGGREGQSDGRERRGRDPELEPATGGQGPRGSEREGEGQVGRRARERLAPHGDRRHLGEDDDPEEEKARSAGRELERPLALEGRDESHHQPDRPSERRRREEGEPERASEERAKDPGRAHGRAGDSTGDEAFAGDGGEARSEDGERRGEESRLSGACELRHPQKDRGRGDERRGQPGLDAERSGGERDDGREERRDREPQRPRRRPLAQDQAREAPRDRRGDEGCREDPVPERDELARHGLLGAGTLPRARGALARGRLASHEQGRARKRTARERRRLG